MYYQMKYSHIIHSGTINIQPYIYDNWISSDINLSAILPTGTKYVCNEVWLIL